MRFVVFIKDPYIKVPFVVLAPVQVQADDELGARSAALDAYNRAATGSLADGEVGFVTALAEDLDGASFVTGILETEDPVGAETVERCEGIAVRNAARPPAGSMRVTSVDPQAPYRLIYKSS